MATADLKPLSAITCNGEDPEPGIGVTDMVIISGGSKKTVGKL